MAKPSKPKQNTNTEPAGVPLTGTKADKRLLQALKEDVAPEATPALQFVMDHAKTITTLVVAVVFIAIAAIAYQWNHKKNIEQAQADISAVLTGAEGAEAVAGLEALIPALPSDLMVGVYNEIVLRAEVLDDLPKAAEYWEKIYNETSDPGFKTVAGLGWAKNLIAQEKLEDADSLLGKLAEEADGSMLSQVEMEQAFLAEKMGNLEKSIEIYQVLLNKKTQFSNSFLITQIEQLRQQLDERPPVEQVE